MHNGQEVTFDGYLTELLGQAAKEFIHAQRAQPWMLYAAFNAPHIPSQATQKYLDRFPEEKAEPRRTYCATVSALDDAVGEILAQVRADDLEQETLVFFFSDNGGPLERNGSLNDPLSGEKGGMLEGGIRVPFLVQWKGHLPAGKTYERPVSSLDVLPTALALAKLQPDAERPLDGVDILPYLLGEKSGDPHERLFWRMKARGIWAMREGDEKLVMQKSKRNKHPGGDQPRLIRLDQDLAEKNDLAATQPDRARALQKTFDAWNAELIEPLWGPGEDDDAGAPRRVRPVRIPTAPAP